MDKDGFIEIEDILIYRLKKAIQTYEQIMTELKDHLISKQPHPPGR